MLRFFVARTGTSRLPEPASPPTVSSAAVYASVGAVTKSPAVVATAWYVAMLAAIDMISALAIACQGTPHSQRRSAAMRETEQCDGVSTGLLG
jgi:hypothetical protein